jgi:hypothetical protein
MCISLVCCITIIIRIFLPSTANIGISRTENSVSGLHICKVWFYYYLNFWTTINLLG